MLSGSAGSANAGTAPDPGPVFIVDGQRSSPELPGIKRGVLTAAGPTDFVLSTSDGSAQWLDTYRDARLAHKVRVNGFQTSWQESADRTRALAITTLGAGERAARWFQHGATGWQPGELSIPVAGTTSCVSPDGDRALLIGRRPALIDRSGGQDPVTDLELAGTCALAAAGGILADLAHGGDGLSSDIRVFAADRGVTFSRRVSGEATVSADPSAARVSYTAHDTVHELNTQTGTQLRAITGIRAARYDAPAF